MRATLMVFFIAVLVAMTWVTVTASLDRGVFVAAAEIWQDPWGRATLFDAYFAFLTTYLWIAWRERGLVARIAWLVAFLILGNFAIATYCLLALWSLGPGGDVGGLFERKRLPENDP